MNPNEEEDSPFLDSDDGGPDITPGGRGSIFVLVAPLLLFCVMWPEAHWGLKLAVFALALMLAYDEPQSLARCGVKPFPQLGYLGIAILFYPMLILSCMAPGEGLVVQSLALFLGIAIAYRALYGVRPRTWVWMCTDCNARVRTEPGQEPTASGDVFPRSPAGTSHSHSWDLLKSGD
jgi:hypothetical protein